MGFGWRGTGAELINWSDVSLIPDIEVLTVLALSFAYRKKHARITENFRSYGEVLEWSIRIAC